MVPTFLSTSSRPRGAHREARRHSKAGPPRSKTKSMPFGNIEAPVNPISLALAAGATFVARGYSGEQKHLTELIKQGIEHEGFSFLDVFSPCVTYNHDNTYQWFRPRVKKLEEDSSYDATDWTR